MMKSDLTMQKKLHMTWNPHVKSSSAAGSRSSLNKMWRWQECTDQHHHGEAAEI
jgi:hypothetical protein